MNNKIKFLEIVLSDLISERDTLELDLNYTLNNLSVEARKRKEKFVKILESIVNVNNKINTLTEYLAQITATNNMTESVNEEK
tara:strand:+ start:5491 stop:5739 length:249 start_codon:yes stop_codon:yes gene_type:complete